MRKCTLAADIRRRTYVGPILEFEMTVDQLREETCFLAPQLRQAEQQKAMEQQQQEQSQRRRRFLYKVAHAVGGTAVTGVNLAADTGSLAIGVPPWATTLSTNVAQTLIGGALPTG
jgi:hypothetical protein